MKDETRAHLYDIRESARAIVSFVAGKTAGQYSADELVRSAVERKFQIIGEALVRLRDSDSDTLDHIRDRRDIISFRNILVHGYDSIDDTIVWGIIEEDLPRLLADVGELLSR